MSYKLLCAFALFGFVSAAQADESDRLIDQYTCKDITREGGTARDNAIAFLHGYFVGKSGALTFNLEALAKQTDAFIDHCLDNPKEKAIDAMSKVKA